METKDLLLLLGISMATVMVEEEEATKMLTTVLTTPLTMPAAAVVVPVGAAVVVAVALGQLNAPFLCAEIKHRLSFNIAITNIFKDA